MSKRVIGTIGMLGAVALLAVVVIVVRVSHLDARIGLRNTVYALLAAALLLAVLVDAVHHRLARDVDPSTTRGDHAGLHDRGAHGEHGHADDGDGGDDGDYGDAVMPVGGPLLAELRLAARLGAELMGDAPASRAGRSRRDPATLA